MPRVALTIFKNLAKDSIYYTKNGQFGVEDLGYEISIRKVAEWMHDDATVIFHDVLHAQCCFDSTDTGYDT